MPMPLADSLADGVVETLWMSGCKNCMCGASGVNVKELSGC